MTAYTFSTWKQRLLLRTIPDFSFRLLLVTKVTKANWDLHTSWVEEDLQDLEFFCSASVHRELGHYLACNSTNTSKLTRHQVGFTCQIFVLLLVRTDHRDDSIKYVYDWLDPDTAVSVFAQAYAYVEHSSRKSLLPYITALDRLFDNTNYDFECDESITRRTIRLSDLDNSVVVSNLTEIITIEASVPKRLSPSFLVALMLNIDCDEMYPCIRQSLCSSTVMISDPKLQTIVNQNIPETFHFGFDADGRFVGYTPSPEVIQNGEAIFTTGDIQYDM